MNWLRAVTVISLLAIGILAGGVAVRLALAASDRRAAIALGLVVLFVLVVARGGARTRRWRENPYW